MFHRHCRLCGKGGDASEMTQYAVRHHAHFRCYIERGRALSDLKPWQVRRFPFFLLKQHGLLGEADRLAKEA
jgi:hypothetical protein